MSGIVVRRISQGISASAIIDFNGVKIGRAYRDSSRVADMQITRIEISNLAQFGDVTDSHLAMCKGN
jgi:hypothetical protein